MAGQGAITIGTGLILGFTAAFAYKRAAMQMKEERREFYKDYNAQKPAH